MSNKPSATVRSPLDQETIDWMLRQSDDDLVKILFTAGQISSEQYWRLLMPVLRGSRTASESTATDRNAIIEECANQCEITIRYGPVMMPRLHWQCAAAIRALKHSPEGAKPNAAPQEPQGSVGGRQLASEENRPQPAVAAPSAPSAGAPTESRTDEQLIYWLEQKHKRHMKLCDHLAAERLRELTSAPSSDTRTVQNVEATMLEFLGELYDQPDFYPHPHTLELIKKYAERLAPSATTATSKPEAPCAWRNYSDCAQRLREENSPDREANK